MAIYDVHGNIISDSGVTDVNSAKWYNKKIAVDGSSITSGGTGGKSPTWPYYISNALGTTMYNHAVGGSQWVWTFSTGSAYDRISSYESDIDAIITMGDFSSSYSQLGTINDTADISGGTYYARLKAYAEALISAFPLIPIIWAIEPPRNWTDDHNNPGGRAENIAEAITKVGQLYGFPIADCFHNTIYRPYNATNYAANTTDGTHPLNNIQHGMAETIIETMKKTPIVYSVT